MTRGDNHRMLKEICVSGHDMFRGYCPPLTLNNIIIYIAIQLTNSVAYKIVGTTF